MGVHNVVRLGVFCLLVSSSSVSANTLVRVASCLIGSILDRALVTVLSPDSLAGWEYTPRCTWKQTPQCIWECLSL